MRTTGFGLAVLALIAVGIVGLTRGASGHDSAQAMAAARVVTVDLSTLTPAIAGDYNYAADHLVHFSQIPCYCACDDTLGHRNLADCFVTSTGAWDAHASGCAICGIETTAVREQLATGTPIDRIRASIIDQFGPPPSLFTFGVPS